MPVEGLGALRALLGLLLLIAAVGKLHPTGLGRAARAAATLIPGCSKRCGLLAAFGLVGAEAVVGTSLITATPSAAASLGAATVLFGLLAGALSYGLVVGNLEDCACWGVLSTKPPSIWSLTRTTGLFLISGTLAGAELERPSPFPLAICAALTALGALAVAVHAVQLSAGQGIKDRSPKDLIGTTIELPTVLLNQIGPRPAYVLLLSPDCASCREAPSAVADSGLVAGHPLFVGIDETAATTTEIAWLEDRLTALQGHQRLDQATTRQTMDAVNLRWFPLLVKISEEGILLDAIEGVGNLQNSQR